MSVTSTHTSSELTAVAGVALSGGFGPLNGQYGLAADRRIRPRPGQTPGIRTRLASMRDRQFSWIFPVCGAKDRSNQRY
jgi:hypothetical protein